MYLKMQNESNVQRRCLFPRPGVYLTICSPGQMELCFWQSPELFHWPPSQRKASIIRFLFPGKKKKKKRDSGTIRITICLEKEGGCSRGGQRIKWAEWKERDNNNKLSR